MSVTVVDPHAAAQAAEIRRLLARHVPPRDVAAAVGCALARVLAVRDQPDTDPALAATVPTPRPARTAPATAVRRKPALGADELLTAAAGHDDPRINALAAHITADLDTLAALLTIAADREQHARALLAADRKTAAVRAVYDNRHPNRRRTDTPTGETA